MSENRIEELMVRFTDGVASSAEEEELRGYLNNDSSLREELEAHMHIKKVSDQWIGRLALDQASPRGGEENTIRNLGATLFIAGWAILAGFGLVEILVSADEPLWVRVGLGSMIAGSMMIFTSLLIERIKNRKKDKYTEVIR